MVITLTYPIFGTYNYPTPTRVIMTSLYCRLWALTIGAGNGESGWEHNATGAIFTVNITLTDSGLDNVYEVKFQIH